VDEYGTQTEIKGGSIKDNVKQLLLTEDEVDCQIQVQVTPVDISGNEGLTCLGMSPGRVDHIAPMVDSITLRGPAREGSELRVEVNIRGSHDMTHDKITWYRDDGTGKKLIPGQMASRYTPQADDVGKVVSVQYITVSPEGQGGDPVYAETMGLIQPAPPTVSKARFLRVFCGQKVEVKYLYSGGFKGESTFEWMRSVTGTQDWQELDCKGDSYLATADDLNHWLRCMVSPANDKGVKGEPVVVANEQVVLSAKWKNELWKFLIEGQKAFNVLDLSGEAHLLSLLPQTLRLVNQKTGKAVAARIKWTEHVAIVLDTLSKSDFDLLL
jgi:hypothetical protein